MTYCFLESHVTSFILVIYISTVESTLNSSQMFSHQSSPAFSPWNLNLPPPIDGGIYTTSDVLKCLPDKSQSALQMGITYALSRPDPKSVSLLNISPKLWIDEKVISFYQEFRAELLEIETLILEDNKSRLRSKQQPITVILPSKIPVSIEI